MKQLMDFMFNYFLRLGRDCEDMELVTSLTSATYYELGTSIDNSHNDGRALLRLACDGSITHPVRL